MQFKHFEQVFKEQNLVFRSIHWCKLVTCFCNAWSRSAPERRGARRCFRRQYSSTRKDLRSSATRLSLGSNITTAKRPPGLCELGINAARVYFYFFRCPNCLE